MWGLGSLGDLSYRTLIADVADEASAANIPNIGEVSSLFALRFWSQYEKTFQAALARARDLNSKPARTQDETNELLSLLQALSGGFCIGGRWGSSRQPSAFEILFYPTLTTAPTTAALASGSTKFWGVPNLISRLLYGIDEQLFRAILASGKWTGGHKDLGDLVSNCMLAQPKDLPLREAIDWVYASIYTTIKGLKFSHLAPVCGGPIEVAVISSDRPFRWVRHKRLDEAIS